MYGRYEGGCGLTADRGANDGDGGRVTDEGNFTFGGFLVAIRSPSRELPWAC